jgi:hypothetical protein
VFHNQKNNFSNSLESEQLDIKCIFPFHLMTKGRQAKKIGAALSRTGGGMTKTLFLVTVTLGDSLGMLKV